MTDSVSQTLPAGLAAAVQGHLKPETGPGPGPFFSVGLEGVRRAAGFLEANPRQAMAALLEHDHWPRRLARNRGLFTPAEQARLLASRVAVIGCGGLGGHLVTLLARVGIGALTLCDFDVFDESNLNRQVLSRETNLGRNKAEAAAEEAAAIASHVELQVCPVAAGPDNLAGILAGADLAADALDSLAVRFPVEAAARELGIPFVHGAVAGQEGLTLVSRPGGPGLADWYGAETGAGAEVTAGVPTLTPAGLAVLEAELIVRELLGRGPGSGLWHLDLAGPGLERFEF